MTMSRTNQRDVFPCPAMADGTLLEELAKQLRLLIENYKLDQQVFRRKLKVAPKNVNRWKEAKFWPSVGLWDDYKRAAADFVPEAERPMLKARFAQIDELIRKKNAMKTR